MAGPRGWPKGFNALSSSPRFYSLTSATVRTPVYTAAKGLFTWWWGTPQWGIQGRGPSGGGGRAPLLFLDQIVALRVEKNFFETGPPLSQGLDDPHLPLSEGLDPPLPQVSEVTRLSI